MTIIVGGYIVAYPLGGMTWHHLNYVLGLAEMGHDVWFYEYGAWPPFNPVTQTTDWDHQYGTDYLAAQFSQFGLPQKWCYQTSSTSINLTRAEMEAVFARADLMICVSGITPWEAIKPRPKKTLVIDTDPVFTQIRMSDDVALLDYYRQFDARATFGRLIGTEHCPLPTHGIAWHPTNQPVALRHWPSQAQRAVRIYDLGKWEHSVDRHVELAGRRYLSSKGVEWQKVIDLPRQVDWDFELAMQSMPPERIAEFESHGWKIVDGEQVSADCVTFRDFVARSAGEFTVAKQIYSQIPSGWFSDRSAAYLASGRPVVAQDTGFDRWLPTGEGLFKFHNLNEAAAALSKTRENYEIHAASARDIAERYFASDKVLADLLDRTL